MATKTVKTARGNAIKKATSTVKASLSKKHDGSTRHRPQPVVSELQVKLNKLNVFQIEAIKWGLERLKQDITTSEQDHLTVTFGDKVLNIADIDEILKVIDRQK